MYSTKYVQFCLCVGENVARISPPGPPALLGFEVRQKLFQNHRTSNLQSYWKVTGPQKNRISPHVQNLRVKTPLNSGKWSYRLITGYKYTVLQCPFRSTLTCKPTGLVRGYSDLQQTHTASRLFLTLFFCLSLHRYNFKSVRPSRILSVLMKWLTTDT